MLIHGKSNTPEYHVWENMIARCFNSNDKAYKDYGGRGITVCDEWRNFERFYSNMGNRPSEKHQIDRRNNNGNYEPGNCKWTTQTVNLQNKRTSLRWVIENRVCYFSAMFASKDIGVNASTIHRWCKGYTQNGRYIPPKDGYYSFSLNVVLK